MDGVLQVNKEINATKFSRRFSAFEHIVAKA